jgi:hypothetical protein
LNIRILSLTSAMALLAVTAAFGQSPFPSVSGQQAQPQGQQASPSPFPSVSGQPQQKQASPFPSVGGSQPAASPAAAPGGFPSVSGGAAAPAAAAAPIVMPPGMSMGAPGGAFGAPQQQQPPCMDDFMKLRGETEKRGKAIQAASKRKAPPTEACKLIVSYIEADLKMISFVETNAKSCGIPPNIPADMKKQHAGVQQLRGRVCDAAAQAATQQPKGPSFSDVLGTATLPEASTTTRSGGSTFDTLSGNALAPR